VIGGPTQANSLWWWNIDYDTLPDGWSAEDYLTTTTGTLNEFGQMTPEKATQLASIATQLETVQSTLDAYKANPAQSGASTLATIASALAHLQELISQIGR
jgi:hypothetical protein